LRVQQEEAVQTKFCARILHLFHYYQIFIF